MKESNLSNCLLQKNRCTVVQDLIKQMRYFMGMRFIADTKKLARIQVYALICDTAHFQSGHVVQYIIACIKSCEDKIMHQQAKLVYRVSPKNAPTSQCHIIKNVKFCVFKFSTVIQHGLKQCTDIFDLITSTYSNCAGI